MIRLIFPNSHLNLRVGSELVMLVKIKKGDREVGQEVLSVVHERDDSDCVRAVPMKGVRD